MKRKLLTCAGLLGAFLVCGPVLAHHGTAAYQNKISVLKHATVTRFAWANPHSLIFADVKNANGKTTHWVVETAAPQALRLIGWSKESLAPGDVITIYLYAAKDGNSVGRLNHLILPDGTRLEDTILGGKKHPK